MSIVTNLFSALGNNSSLYPIIFKDGVDITGRTIMAYNEGSKTNNKYGVYGARESFLEETTTSVVWLAGIPALKLLYDRIITNNVFKFKNMPELGTTFDKKGNRVLADTNLKLLGNGLQTLQENIDNIVKSKDFATNKVLQDLVANAQKILDKQNKFKKLYAGKMAFATVIPLTLIGFILPKLIQKMTKAIYKNDKELNEKRFAKHNTINKHPDVFSAFCGKPDEQNNNVSFKGNYGNLLIDFFNNDVANQVVLDAGISTGRIVTGVNFADKVEKAIKEAGIVFFIYLGGTIVGGLLEKIARKLGMPISLDPKILEDKAFQNKILEIAKADPAKQEQLKKGLLLFEENEKGEILELKKFQQNILEIVNSDDKNKEKLLGKLFNLDNNPDQSAIKVLKEKIAKIASKEGLEQEKFIKELFIIKTIDEHAASGIENTTLKAAHKVRLVELIEGFKNPLKHINTNDVHGLNSSIKEFVDTALSKGSYSEVEKFLKKSLSAKRGSVILNLAICSAFTGYIIPKLQYVFREKYTNATHLPSLATYDEQIAAEKSAAKTI